MYKIDSDFATEFICDTEILESLDYAKKNKNNSELAKNILEHAKNLNGLSHGDTIILLENDSKKIEQKNFFARESSKSKILLQLIKFFRFILSR